MPVMRAVRARRHDYRFFPCGSWRLHGPSRLRIESGGPRDAGYKRRSGDELAGLPVEDIEKPVLVRLHDHFAGSPADIQVSLHQWLRSIVVPAIAGRRLE